MPDISEVQYDELADELAWRVFIKTIMTRHSGTPRDGLPMSIPTDTRDWMLAEANKIHDREI